MQNLVIATVISEQTGGLEEVYIFPVDGSEDLLSKIVLEPELYFSGTESDDELSKLAMDLINNRKASYDRFGDEKDINVKKVFAFTLGI